MKAPIVPFALSMLLCAQSSMALPAERTNHQVFKDVATAVTRYDRFTVFDDISVQVTNGVVTLEGSVTMPYKRGDIEERVARVDGVQTVVNNVAVLPISTWDDHLRRQIARAIYGNVHFWGYGASANPSIHIIVDRGRVTLTGVVQNDVERMLAASLVNEPGVFSVTNHLQTN